MSLENARGPATYAKVAILVLGFIILVVGLHSHFQSTWAKAIHVPLDDYGYTGSITVWPFEVCRFKNLIPEMSKKSCPPISLERYFVSVIIICFLLSLLGLIARIAMDLQSLSLVDAGYHGIAAFVLFIAGIVYAVSANQIHGLYSDFPDADETLKALGINFRKSEKLAAAALTIIQSLLYGITAVLLVKS